MKQYVLLAFLSFSLFACEKEINFQFNPERKTCVICILNPDSTVHLSLHYTRSLVDTTDFVPITEAAIELFENDTLWGTGKTDDSGHFYLDQKPLEGKTYSLKITKNGMPPIAAQTTVQQKPQISYTVLSKEKNENWSNFSEFSQYYLLDNEYQLTDKQGKDYYWNYVLFWYPSPNHKKYNFSSQVSFVSPYIDDFNRVIEAESPNGFYYRYYARFLDDAIDGQQINFSKRTNTRIVDVFFNADEHFDRYMKSSVQQKLIDEDDLPFAEPVEIYSNIENGTGIFGSASFTYLSFRNE